MEDTKPALHKKRTVAARVGRVIFRIILIFALVIFLLALSILTPPVQNFIKAKATVWLSNKLKTKVQVGKIYIGFPKKVVLEGIYVEDKQKDTLLYGGKVQVDISMLKLLHSELELNQVQISDLTAKVKRVLPDTVYNFQFIIDAFASKDTVKTGTADTSSMRISVKNIALDRVRLVYKDDIAGNDADLALGHFDTEFNDFDLNNMDFRLNNISLNNTMASVHIRKQQTAKIAIAKTDTVAAEKTSLRILVKNISFDNNNIVFDNDNNVPVKKGMDYMHLNIKGLTLHADNFLYAPDSMGASITKGSMSEKSGFQLDSLQTDFLYAANQTYLHNLLIKTPGTTLRRSAGISYPSIDSLKKDIGQMKLNIDLYQSKVQVKDILTFAPFLSAQPAFANPDATWLLDGNITGSVANMNIHKFRLTAFTNTNLDVHGIIAGLPDSKRIRGNLVINSLHTSRKDIELLVPKGSLPKDITIPEMISLHGTIAGSMNDARANLALTSSLGAISVNGSISDPRDKKHAKYNATLVTRQLELGKILRNDSLYGPLSATFMATGRGFDQKTAKAKINLNIISGVFNRYNYKNVKISGQFADQLANLALDVKDPSIAVNLDAKANLAQKFPAVSITAMIDSIKTLPLHFTSNAIEYRGNITADFPITDPKNPEGKLFVTKSLLKMQGQRYALDTIKLIAGKTDTGQFVRLNTDIISFALTGKYNLAQLGSVFQQAVQPYYALSQPAQKPDTLDDYDFNFSGRMINGPLIKAFLPTLNRLDPVTLNGHFAKNKGFQMNLDAPLVVIGNNRIQKFSLNTGTANNSIRVRAELEQFSAGSSMTVYNTNLRARIADNKINFLFNVKDPDRKNKYRLGGEFAQSEKDTYTLWLNRDSILLNYDKWAIGSDNKIRLDNSDINISNFRMSNKGQVLSINSTTAQRNSPLEIKFDNFRIGTITAFAKQDSLLADGTINGNVLVKNITGQPVFTSDLKVTDLIFVKDTVGNLAIKVSSTAENLYAADISLTGKGNNISINGNYKVKPANQSVINLKMDIHALQMKAVEAFSFGGISKSSGYINGNLNVSGTFDKPDIEGKLNFNKTGFSPTMLGSYFTIDQQEIYVDNEGINFDNFTILDSSKNKLTLDGNAYTANFANYKFDMDLSATNFEALNSTKANNKLFYGNFYFDTDMQITGTEAAPVVDGDLSVNKNTKLTIQLPEDAPGVVEREGIVKFVDVDSVKTDTTLLLAKDTLSKSGITGMDISVNIDINKEAELTLIIDEMNGDFLRMQGSGELTGGIDPSGKTTLAGTYEIDKGAYNLSFNFIKRQFNIKKGSKITWLGEPTRANLDLTAIYVANTSPQTLVDQGGGTTNATYKQKIPFQVNLILEGKLLKPTITFDITLPENQNFNVSENIINDVQNRLVTLRGEPDELNKQVFALLLLNRFVAENPFASSGDGGFNAGTAARQSVSKLLSDQLNNLASDLIKGVDLNFDLASNEDYTTGEMQNRTDLNVSLSKQLLNDRLKVTVGSDFELEGPQSSSQRSNNNLAGDVALDYTLSKDGRYLIRVYRKNEYEGELDGYIIETGVNFIIRFDYDRFSELFHSPKKKLRQQWKRQKKENNRIKDAQKNN